MILKKAWEWLVAIVAIYYIAALLGLVLIVVGSLFIEMFAGNSKAWIVFSILITIMLAGLIHALIGMYRNYIEDLNDPFFKELSSLQEEAKPVDSARPHKLNLSNKPVPLTREQMIERMVEPYKAEGHDPEQIREMIESYGF